MSYRGCRGGDYGVVKKSGSVSSLHLSAGQGHTDSLDQQYLTYISVHDIQNVLAVEWARAQVLGQKGLRQCSTTAVATATVRN